MSKTWSENKVGKAIARHSMQQEYGVITTCFLEECMLEGKMALLTENLHKEDYTYLDANAHLLREEDKLLRVLDFGFGVHIDEKEPEEERWFADHRFAEITNLMKFAKVHVVFLEKVRLARIYLAYDSYYFRVNRQKTTDIDYLIADWDDVTTCDEQRLQVLNKGQFKDALWQFVDKYVEEEIGERYKDKILNL